MARPIVAVIVCKGQLTYSTYALLDSGASCCGITVHDTNKLKIKRGSVDCEVTSWNQVEVGPHDTASFTVRSIDGSLELEVEEALVSNKLAARYEVPIRQKYTKNYPYMKDVVINDLDHDNVGILLGSRFIRHFFGKEVRMGEPHEPIALLTNFGWVVTGPIPEMIKYNADVASLTVNEKELQNIDRMIRRMYMHDFISRPDEEFPAEYCHNSQYDAYAIEQVKQTIKYDEKEGKYSVGLPWTYGRAKTKEIFDQQNFYGYALNRTIKLKQKFMKDPVLREGSFKQVEENLKNGYTEIINDLTAHPEGPVCYMACHVALHDDKPGKFRVCQDAAGKVNGHCLNGYLLSGPDTLNSLFGIVLRFRRHKYVLSADIKDFFYRVMMDVKDRAACRFLWFTDETMTQMQVYQGLCHLFGLASSPSIANLVLSHHARKMREKYGLQVMVAMMIAFYVDDYLQSMRTVEEARVMKRDLTQACLEGGFHLLKWKSNIKELNDPIPPPPPPPPPKQESDNGGDAPDGLPTPSTALGDPPESDAETENLERISAPSTTREDAPDFDEFEQYSDEQLEELSDQIDNAFKNGDAGTYMGSFTKDLGDKVLGTGYDFEEDVLYIRVREKLYRDINTKRQLLSWISQIYDPLGIISPYILKGRIFFQQVNLEGTKWNENVSEGILKEFSKWKAKVIHLRNYKIPRWTSTLGMEDSVSKLIIFSDASKVGFGVVAYTRRELKGSPDQSQLTEICNVHISFIMSKSHVVPLVMMKELLEGEEDHLGSIPKLELCAAKVAAQWRDTIIRQSEEVYEEVIMFTDSLTVKGWIRDWKRKLKSFEHFRIRRIRMLTKVAEWWYCPTKLNPADICSKGLNADESEKWSIFHQGPAFLREPPENWPKEPAATKEEEEERKTAIKAISALWTVAPVELVAVGGTSEEVELEHQPLSTPWPLLHTEKLSTWRAKVRRLSVLRHALNTWRESARSQEEVGQSDKEPVGHSYNLRSKGTVGGSHEPIIPQEQEFGKVWLTLSQKEESEKLLLRAIQTLHFDKEITTLLKLGVFEANCYEELKSKSSKLLNLSPFLDEDGLMRVGGRLGKSKSLPYDTRHPIIMPNSDTEVIQSLIRHCHTQNYHCSIIETFYILRQKYYFLGGRNSVKKVVNRCLDCQLAFKQPSPQKMGELPEARVSMAVPFQTSGMDVFGEFWVKTQGRANKKRWVLLITCFVTRAIALYPLQDMSLSSVVNALIKMNCQFPSLKNVVTDNGPNFKGASRELREAMEAWNLSQANDELSDKGIVWSFGPAYAGSWGGVWERLVGVVKNSFKACLKGEILDTEAFDALLAGVAGMINRRPLTRQNNNDDVLVLSPSHLIYPYMHMQSSTSIIPPTPNSGDHLRSTWVLLREALEEFWARWHKEYLETLQGRKKWQKSTKPIVPGDLVLISEPITPREKWRIARVIKQLNDDKNHPRTFLLTDGCNNQLTRHVTSLIPLELY